LNLNEEQTAALTAIGGDLTNDPVLRVGQEDIAPLQRVQDSNSHEKLDTPLHPTFHAPPAYGLSAIYCDTGEAAEYLPLLKNVKATFGNKLVPKH
jgi:hypothetical protein